MRNKDKQAGFLLLESLVTLSIVVAIILLVYPLVTDWLVLRQDRKELVEQNRVLYEYSLDWNAQQNEVKIIHYKQYIIQQNKSFIQVKKSEKDSRVDIYEVHFE